LQKRFLILSVGLSLSLLSTMILVVPMIESFSQRSLINFFEGNKGSESVFIPAYFKTYAHYFYGKTTEKMPSNLDFRPENIANNKVFIVCKVQHKDKLLASNKNLRYLSEGGGYVFFLSKN